MTLATAKLALPYPELTDTVDVPRDVLALASKLDTISASFASGLYTARPAAGVAGRVFTATDTGGVYMDTGTAWKTIAPPYIAAGGALPTTGLATGDEVYFQISGGASLWHCKYDSSIGDAYKWWVLAGAPIVGSSGTAIHQQINTQTYSALTGGITLTLPRAGIYDIGLGGNMWSNAAAIAQGVHSYTVGATAADDDWGNFVGMGVMQAACFNETRQTFPAGTLTCIERARVTANMTVQYANRRLIARPVRII